PRAPQIGGRWLAQFETDTDPHPGLGDVDDEANAGREHDGELDVSDRGERFDPDAFRGRALRWDRKLAGERAALYPEKEEVRRGTETVDVHADAGGARGDAGAL